MVDFGARLSLKDNMSATLQKNLKIQKEFSKQAKELDATVRGLGKKSANPVVNLRDNATGKIIGIKRKLRAMSEVKALTNVEIENEALQKADEITKKIKKLGAMVVSPVIKLKDLVSAKADNVKKKLKDIATNYTPAIKLRNLASQGLAKIKNTLNWLKVATITPVIKVKDMATKTVNKVKVGMRTVGKLVAKPFVQLKDKVSAPLKKVSNTLKTVGKTVAKPFVAIKDGATKVLGKVKEGLKTVGKAVAEPLVKLKDKASAGLSKLKSTLSSLAKGITVTVGIAGAGLTALLGGALGEGAKLQQSKGGVETLYGEDASAVIANAEQAYKTAGLSANAYMETVTSFSASLLQSLGGDTAKSADIANMAIIDMADNANKFGTDMESIQTAYQGFAKQNYTMLDNLKLGYGGTKEEMERLLVDAQKLTGVKYDINNLSDVYSAIHAIQEDLGVADATADEAEKTFTGSFSAMKASAQNFLGALSTGGDVKRAMTEMIESASTFLFNNAIPMIGNVFTALPSAISAGIKTAIPKLKEQGGEIAKSIKDGLKAMLPSSMGEAIDGAFSGISNIVTTLSPVITQIGEMFGRVAPVIANTLGGAFSDSGGFIENFANMLSGALPTVESILTGLSGAFASVLPIVGTLGSAFVDVFPDILSAVNSVIPVITPIIETLGSVISAVVPVAKDVISVFSQTIQQVMPIVSQIFSSVASVVMPIVSAVASLIQSAMPIVSNIITMVTNIIASVAPTFTQIFGDIGSKVQEIVGIVQQYMPLLQSIFETVSPIIQNAIEIVKTVLSSAWAIISPIIDLAIAIFGAVLAKVQEVFPTIQNIIQKVWGVLEPIFSAIASGLSAIGDAVGGAVSWVTGLFSGGSSNAYGKGRVPYDNYPARLHQGEKVLTRNQADQYDRHMSTRGVQLTETSSSDKSTTTTSIGSSTEVVKEITQTATPAPVFKIDKLAETVVIEKDADVDKVVEEMVNKFRKLVPNMA